MYPNLWTEKAREAVASAQNLAEERHNPQVEPEHLLLALERQQQGVVSRIPQRLNADPRAIAAAARVIYLTARCTWHALCETSR